MNRVNFGYKANATQFTDARTMELAIADTLAANRAQINTWLAGHPPAGHNISPTLRSRPGFGNLGGGYEWSPAAGKAVKIADSLEGCVVVLKSDGAGGYFIQTAFPER
jgi:hypothetical protein